MSDQKPITPVYSRLTEATRQYFNAQTSYVQRYDDSGTLEQLSGLGQAEGGGELAAGFRLSDGTLLIRQDAVALLQQFLAGEFTSGDISKYGWEMRQLRRVHDVFVSIVHENVHALGPRGPRQMQAEWETARYPHVPLLSEGIAELAAQRCCGDILQMAGLTAIDPRIALAVSNEELMFPGAVTAVDGYLRMVGTLTGATQAAELATMIRDGGAKAALDNSVRRIMGAQGLGALPMDRSLTVFMALSRVIETAFVDITDSPFVGRETSMRSATSRSRMGQLKRDIQTIISHERGGPSDRALIA